MFLWGLNVRSEPTTKSVSEQNAPTDFLFSHIVPKLSYSKWLDLILDYFQVKNVKGTRDTKYDRDQTDKQIKSWQHPRMLFKKDIKV